jgi:hypothetical protein
LPTSEYFSAATAASASVSNTQPAASAAKCARDAATFLSNKPALTIVSTSMGYRASETGYPRHQTRETLA